MVRENTFRLLPLSSSGTMRYALAVAFWLLASSIVSAQHTGKLAGRVLDQEGRPTPGANVMLEGTHLGDVAGLDGSYFILGIPFGEYSVQVQHSAASGLYERSSDSV